MQIVPDRDFYVVNDLYEQLSKEDKFIMIADGQRDLVIEALISGEVNQEAL